MSNPIRGPTQVNSSTLAIPSLGLDWAFSTMKYGNKWKSYRRLFREYMGPGPVKTYEDTLRKAADSLLVRLANDPKRFREHTKLSVCALS